MIQKTFTDMDNLMQQIVNISKAGAYDIVSKQRDELVIENNLLKSRIKEMIAVLEECEEYFDNRQDADHNGENFVPNTEMKLLAMIIDVK